MADSDPPADRAGRRDAARVTGGTGRATPSTAPVTAAALVPAPRAVARRADKGPGAAPPDPIAIADRLAETLVPRFADFAAVHLDDRVVHGGSQPPLPGRRLLLHRVAALDVGIPGRLRELLRAGDIMRWRPDGPLPAALERGECFHVGHADATAADQLADQLALPALATALACRAVSLVPLICGDGVIGNVLLIGNAGRAPLADRDVAILTDLARWAADGIAYAGRCRQEQRIAQELRRRVRPRIPARAAGVELRYRYLPESRAEHLGGDWVDAISLPRGRTALVVGDVSGHGVQAAVMMSQCKTMVRSLAGLDLPPDELLRHFDRLVRQLGDEQGEYDEVHATCLYAVYDPAARRCHVASAGHPPPTLVHPDGRCQVLRPPSGAPAGVGGVGIQTRGYDTADGSVLALYTDGLVEGFHRDLDQGVAALGSRLGGPPRPLDLLCDDVVGALATGHRRDDMTMLVARLLGTADRAEAAATGARGGADTGAAVSRATPGCGVRAAASPAAEPAAEPGTRPDAEPAPEPAAGTAESAADPAEASPEPAGADPAAALDGADARPATVPVPVPGPGGRSAADPAGDGHAAEAVPGGGTLPAETTSFVGRRVQLDRLGRLLRSARLVTLTGTAGAGKSRTARRAAAAAEPEFTHGVRLVELAGVTDPDLLVRAVADAIGVGHQSARPQLDVIRDYLADRRLLLVLDGCEHLVEHCARLAAALLRAAPGLRLLATSRQALGITGEHIVTIPPLAFGPVRADQTGAPAGSGPGEAAALFAERAAAVVPGFALTAANADAVDRICRRLDGIPLAIELAAGRLRTMSLDELLAGLDDRFALLVAGAGAAHARHQTLRVAIGWSHELCTPEEKLLWARLTVFAGDFDLAAAESVCSDRALPAGQVLDLVSGLVEKSILVRDVRDGRQRYHMLDSIRDYGLASLGRPRRQAALRRRHRDWYLGLARSAAAGWLGPDQVECCRRLREDHGNIRAALEASVSEPGPGREGLALATAMWPHWIVGGFAAEGRQWLERALALDAEPGPLRARALWMAGRLATLQGDYAPARGFLAECQNLAEHLHDEAAFITAQQCVAGVAASEGDHSRAILLYHDALSHHRALGDRTATALAVSQLALCYCLRGDDGCGDLDRAAAICDDTLRAVGTGERWCTSNVLSAYGLALWSLGRGPEAERAIAESVRLNRPLHDRLGLGTNLELLAWIAAGDGRPVRAGRLIGAARRIWHEMGLTLSAIPQLLLASRKAARQVNDALGSAGAAAAIAYGRDVTLDAAVEAALSGSAEQGPAISGRNARTPPW